MAETRLEYIIECLEKNGRVKVADLSRDLNCSEVTIRSDIQKLEERGLVRRIHGGAVKQEDFMDLMKLIVCNMTREQVYIR